MYSPSEYLFLLETNTSGSYAIPPMHRTRNLISVFKGGRVVVEIVAVMAVLVVVAVIVLVLV